MDKIKISYECRCGDVLRFDYHEGIQSPPDRLISCANCGLDLNNHKISGLDKNQLRKYWSNRRWKFEDL